MSVYEAMKQFDMYLYSYEGNFSRGIGNYSLRYHNNVFRSEHTLVSSPEEFAEVPVPKLLMRMIYEESLKIEDYMKDHPSKEFVMVRTQPTVLEFMDPSISKGNALKLYSERNHISLKNIRAKHIDKIIFLINFVA